VKVAEDERIEMWDRRDRLVAELCAVGLLPERTLYIRREDGSVCAVGKRKDSASALSIEWRGETAGFTTVNRPRLTISPYEQKSEGFGGILGIGEKGGVGWMLQLLDEETVVWETSLLPGMTAIADMLYSEDRFLNGKRKKRIIPLWQLRPESEGTCGQILSVWERLLNVDIDGQE